MAKVNLPSVVSGYNLQKINDNDQAIATELNENVLYRRSPKGEPNEMHNNLDMNSNRIYNLPAPGLDHEPVRLKDINDLIANNGDQSEAKYIQYDPYGFTSAENVQGAIYQVVDEVEGVLDEMESLGESLDDIQEAVDSLAVKADYTVTDYGAVGDGVTDSTVGIQTAIDLARDNGGVVYIPAGTYLVSDTLTVYHKTALKGSSRHNTIIQLASGTNKDVISGVNARALISSPTFVLTDGSNEVEITDLTVDGGRSVNLTAGAGIVIYGYATKIRNVYIRNCRGDGLYTGWSDGVVSMEGTFENIVIDTVGTHGWRFHGPHDSHTINMMVIDASQNTDKGYNGIYTHSQYTNGRFFNIHIWHRSTAVNRCGYAFSSGGANEIVASHLEGCDQQLEHRASGDRVIGCLIYAPFGDNTGALVVFNGNSNQHIGNRYSADGAPPINNNTYAIQFGASNVVSNNKVVGGDFSGFGNLGVFNYANSGGNYVLACRGYAAPGGVTTFAGTMHNNDEVDYEQTGTYFVFRRFFQPPAHADNAAALSAGLPTGTQYRNTSTNALSIVV